MPLKKIKRAVKKITKPISRVLDKVIPNEINQRNRDKYDKMRGSASGVTRIK